MRIWDLLSVQLDLMQFMFNTTTIAASTVTPTPTDNWAKTASPNKNVKVYIGAPAASSAAGSGYVSAATLGKIAQETRAKYSSFGGIMLWDASQAYGNGRFDIAIKNAIAVTGGGNGGGTTTPDDGGDGECEPEPTSTKKTSSSSTPASTSKTSSTSTAKTSSTPASSSTTPTSTAASTTPSATSSTVSSASSEVPTSSSPSSSAPSATSSTPSDSVSSPASSETLSTPTPSSTPPTSSEPSSTPKTSSTPSSSTPSTTPTTPATSSTPTPTSGICGGVSSWGSSNVYVGGNKVISNGHLWTAKWWTQGDLPGGLAGVWADSGVCPIVGTSPSATSESSTPTSGSGGGNGGGTGGSADTCTGVSTWYSSTTTPLEVRQACGLMLALAHRKEGDVPVFSATEPPPAEMLWFFRPRLSQFSRVAPTVSSCLHKNFSSTHPAGPVANVSCPEATKEWPHGRRRRKEDIPQIQTLVPARLRKSDFIDVANMTHSSIRVHSNPKSTRMRFGFIANPMLKTQIISQRFPPDARGFLYYHHDPSLPATAGEIRFRLTPYNDPVLFESGKDLLGRFDIPWAINLLSLTYGVNAPLKQQLLADGLVEPSLMEQVEKSWGGRRFMRQTKALHYLEHPFEADLTKPLCLRIFTPAAIDSVFIERLLPDYRSCVRKEKACYTGRLLLRLERSTLPEHSGTEAVVLRVLKILEPVLPIRDYDMRVPMPRKGELLQKMVWGGFETEPFSIDLNDPPSPLKLLPSAGK
ncbi:hypothetical protein H0H81_001613 [Sphagnurus paluster]|uniref:Chitin-binding type-3 domain-containing protein n=1 Tax=Sphagnurus paluster TaxID=117069 RepID=A0A9P7GTM4_9AGAR|nr:hypothetical protein H0H81_001613 [Sphagnurus paluster]